MLKQELQFTQQQLSTAEKHVLALKDDIKTVEAERQRLFQLKMDRQDKFKELEMKCNKSDLMNNVDTDKLLIALQV